LFGVAGFATDEGREYLRGEFRAAAIRGLEKLP